MRKGREELSEPTGRISSHRVYTGRVVSLDVDKVRFPNGATGELEMMRHPGASAIVPLSDAGDEDPEVLLIRQYRYAANGYVFEIPAGRLDRDESPEECARRELREETGYSVARTRKLTTIYTTPGFTDERIHIFVGEGLSRGVAAHEADEFLEVHFVPLSQGVRMVRSGEIVDGKTIIGLLLAILG